jgi:hypothetical protein
MLRGEFIRKSDGLVIPNNVMTYGVRTILRAALRNEAITLHAALANCNPDSELAAEQLNEPTIGVNGYARQVIARSNVGWPVYSSLNGETYLETAAFVFAAAGGNFDKPVNRLAIIDHLTQTNGQIVVALSSALPPI